MQKHSRQTQNYHFHKTAHNVRFPPTVAHLQLQFGILKVSCSSKRNIKYKTHNSTMAPGDKEKTSWIGRILGRDDNDEYDDFQEIDLDDAFDIAEEDEESFEDEGVFDLDEKESRIPTRTSGTEDLQINLLDTADTLIAQALVPGVDDNKIEIDLNREMLTITTGSNEHCVEKEGDYLYEELSFGSFSRSILLPAEVEVEDAKAEVKDGVLTIHMPKIDKAAHKKLSVKKK